MHVLKTPFIEKKKKKNYKEFYKSKNHTVEESLAIRCADNKPPSTRIVVSNTETVLFCIRQEKTKFWLENLFCNNWFNAEPSFKIDE